MARHSGSQTITKLPSGLTIATVEIPHVESLSLGIWAGVGGRYEPAPLQGISHFIEHMLFKGTRRMSAREISETVEGVGGYMNAYTCEDHTCFHAKARAEQWEKLLEVLLDMFLCSAFDPLEIEKERSVIKEELAMDLDQPHEYIHDLLQEILWPGHPLGRNLTGTRQTLSSLSREQMLDFMKANYVASNTFVIAAGNIQPGRFRKAVAGRAPKFRRGIPPRCIPVSLSVPGPQVRYLKKKTAQAQLALGVRVCSRYDPRRFALKLLSTILGENMSSRLFQAVREDEALAYSIQSSLSLYEDTGALTISAGLDTPQLWPVLKLISRELKRLTRETPSPTEVQRAKDYVLGQMTLNLEGSENQMMWAGEQLLAYGKLVSQQAIQKNLLAVRPAEIRVLAQDIFRGNNMRLALISPEGETARLEKFVQRF